MSTETVSTEAPAAETPTVPGRIPVGERVRPRLDVRRSDYQRLSRRLGKISMAWFLEELVHVATDAQAVDVQAIIDRLRPVTQRRPRSTERATAARVEKARSRQSGDPAGPSPAEPVAADTRPD